MRSVVLCFLVAFSTWASACIFSDGFDMNDACIIGYGNVVYLAPQVVTAGGSSPGFLSDPDNLFDGQPSTITSIQWTDGTQTTSSATGIQFEPVYNPNSSDWAIVGVVGILNTSLPAGLVIQLYEGAFTGSPVATSFLQTNAQGTTSGWFILPANIDPGSRINWVVVMRNDVGGTSPISASAVFTVGEIAVFAASEWGMTRDAQFGSATTPQIRLASSGVQWKAPAPRVRTINLNLTPLEQKDVFDADGTSTPIDIESLIYQIYESNIVAILPFLNFDPATYGVVLSKSTPQIVSKTAYLAQIPQAPTIKAVAGSPFYNVNFQFQESI